MIRQKSMYLRVIVIFLAWFVLFSVGINMAYAGDNGGPALDFGGVDEVVIAPLDGGTALNPVTVEMWVRPTSGTNVGIFQWALELTATEPFILFHYNSDTFQLYVDGTYRISTSIPAETWTHMAATYDGANWRLYKNGILVGTYTGGTTHRGHATSVYFGNGYNGFWNGQIDEARIWNVARTQSEIQANMYRQLTPAYPSSLIAYYRFNDVPGTTAASEISTSNNGTLVNMENGDWISSTAPLGNLTTHQNDMTAMWAGQPSTAVDVITTGLNIANVGFLNDVGDDIIFGHNGVGFANVDTYLPAGVDKRWARVWELDVNDAAGTTGGNVNLTFDISDAGGQGNFGSSGTYTYTLLGRAAGSVVPFSIISVVGSPTVTDDQLTFTVNASNLGSEFTLGATADSPTAIRLETLSARPSADMQMILPVGMLLTALGGVVLLWRRRRSMR